MYSIFLRNDYYFAIYLNQNIQFDDQSNIYKNDFFFLIIQQCKLILNQ